MRRFISSIILAIALLTGLQTALYASSTPLQESASGTKELNPNKAAIFDPLLVAEMQRDELLWGEGVVLDVDIGPNLYAYVNQNPWSKFDPLGLETLDRKRERRKENQDTIETNTEALKDLKERGQEGGENWKRLWNGRANAVFRNIDLNSEISSMERSARQIKMVMDREGVEWDSGNLDDRDPLYADGLTLAYSKGAAKELALWYGGGKVAKGVGGAITRMVGAARTARVARAANLTQIGSGAWRSPAGLKYIGRDPAGLNRIQHVLKHADDMPGRPGSHGVFDGGRKAVLEMVDRAWLRAQQLGIKAATKGGRSTFQVPMGERVGYMGGQAGAGAGNPALETIFFILEEGTTNVISAFPK